MGAMHDARSITDGLSTCIYGVFPGLTKDERMKKGIGRKASLLKMLHMGCFRRRQEKKSGGIAPICIFLENGMQEGNGGLGVGNETGGCRVFYDRCRIGRPIRTPYRDPVHQCTA